ncbi:G-D-S-L family lipolytic protein [Nodosilinea sp. LEGE 07088]|uniref:GDSL-type esterase/lipase family protein n=1 Tax=Nodosilinea sp. LEGE 07088 TaxID=2777968 RepID=UPI00187EFDC4|nr:GDSL-type esterase/lipase family protein [Nodosilinea sp. LEGE 07088]MBE9139357.1 G-D-S-L family lipolytic protein [Nodosilinea sp. LEGE 07088]
MDIWLLAAQLMMDDTAPPAEMANHNLAPEEVLAPRTDPAHCPQVNETACPGFMQGLADLMPGRSHRSVVQPPRATNSMGAATLWPRPEAIVVPRQRPAPVQPAPSQPVLPSQSRVSLRPMTGSQLYEFRRATVAEGNLYTRMSPLQYLDQWQRGLDTPTSAQWQALLAAEARIVAQNQGAQSLTIILGDSLGLWLPVDGLPTNQLWLNQSISGETTAHILQRLDYFAAAQPRAIHIMAGINDLKAGVSDTQIVDNLYRMLVRLKQQHPQARLVVYSLLPTRLEALPSDRIQRVNHQLATLVARQGATFVDLYPSFSDSQGQLRPELTTDGLHLSPQGYTLWRAALVSH